MPIQYSLFDTSSDEKLEKFVRAQHEHARNLLVQKAHSIHDHAVRTGSYEADRDEPVLAIFMAMNLLGPSYELNTKSWTIHKLF